MGAPGPDAAIEAERGKPRRASRKSHLPPFQDSGSGKGKDKVARNKPAKKPRPSRPDETIVCKADRCACGADVSGVKQICRIRYEPASPRAGATLEGATLLDHVDISPVLPHVTRIALHGWRCACSKRIRAAPPAGMTRERRSDPTSTPCSPICTIASTLVSSDRGGLRPGCLG